MNEKERVRKAVESYLGAEGHGVGLHDSYGVNVGANSFSDLKPETSEFILKHFNNNDTILDVGPGSGLYNIIMKDVLGFNNIDCVEVFKPHINHYKYSERYRNVYHSDIMDFKFDYYDIIIMGDILEHLSIVNAQKLLQYIMKKSKCIIVQIPYMYKQGEVYGNVYEIHKQGDLTPKNFLERYPYMKLLCNNKRTGVYYVIND